MPEKSALLTAADKTHIVELARSLHDGGFQIVSLGGTARLVAEAGVPVVLSEDFLGDNRPANLETLPDRARREVMAAYLGQSLSLRPERLTETGWPVLDFAYVNLTPSEPVKSQEHDYSWMKLDKGGDFMVRSAIEGRRPVLVKAGQIPAYIEALQGDGSAPMLNIDYLAHAALSYLVTLDQRAASNQTFLVEREHLPGPRAFGESA